MISQSGEPDFKLGEFWVRPQRNVLERDDSIAQVEARSMAVLVALARRASEVVSKERLIKEVWGDGAFVGEEVLSHAVWELRKAFADSAREPRYLQTIPRKGYRLLVPVVRPRGAPVPVPGVTINHYLLEQELGRGAMGVVFQAVDRRLERPVAIKFLAPELVRDPGALQRFEREARLAASLDHPNLATVLEIGETTEGQRYLVTPLYRGGSLKHKLAQGPLGTKEAMRLIRQLAAGLGAAHQRDIVHRDIKPANLLLDEHGTLKIADFGIAKLVGATDLTRTGAALGTPAYKSPEQSRGEPVDHRSDLWSLGVVFFELMTGRRPFDGEYEQAVVHAILEKNAEAREDLEGRPIPEQLRCIVAKAMAKSKTERYQSADEILRDLEGIAEETRPIALARRSRDRGWRIGVGVAVAALAVAGIFVMRFYAGLSQPKSPPPQEAIYHLAQAQQIWLRGNDKTILNETERHLKRAVALAPDWEEAAAFLAFFSAERFSIQENLKDLELARKFLERSADSQLGMSLVAQARIALLDPPNFELAEKRLRRAIELEPECKKGGNCDLAYTWLADALWQLDKKEEALELLKKGMEVGEGQIRCRLKLAQLYDNSGDKSKAITQYEDVLTWDHHQFTALNELGWLYYQDGKYEESASKFRVLYDRTQDPMAALHLGNALYGQRRWQEAIDAYKQADKLYQLEGRDVPTAAVNIGDVYSEQGKLALAISSYEEAIPTYLKLLADPMAESTRKAQYAVCLAKAGRIQEAESEMAKLLREKARASDLLVYAARIQALKGDRSELFRFALQAIQEGKSPRRLLDDAAFRQYRDDPEYRKLLEPTGPTSKSK